MTVLVAVTVAALFGGGFTLLMTRGLLNRAFGLLLVSHGANLAVMAAGGLAASPAAPLLNVQSARAYADPLPQALILTALVIGFAMAAFMWAVILRLEKEE